METPPITEYNIIKVVGTVSVELIDRLEEVRGKLEPFQVILILGPTGAGKSTFIEALDSNKSLKISSNQLEGFTQSISLYRLIGVERIGDPVYLIDVPGFADTKISEMKIVSMLKDWMKAVELRNIHHVLYFTPVNNPRLPGSHRQVLRTFQALTGVNTGESITVITTMWDCVWNETGRKRAESNFNQLQDEIWKEYVDQRTKILKFHNTQGSALSIMDQAFSRCSGPNFLLVEKAGPIRGTPFGTNLYNNLQQRIENLHMEIANMQSDFLGAAARDDTQLSEMLVQQLDSAQKLLATFEQEMHDFGPPPDIHPTRDILQPQMLQSEQPPYQPVTAPTSNRPHMNSRRIGTFDIALSSLKGLGRKFSKRRED
ncbi:P-loop containing nucleoside triphosphate hydrolase protein [Panaeolus papilionaceus]|nr:P-loop containing nucleoside triphosphate hydrolase protein [Panaeolus papilionaceus]